MNKTLGFVSLILTSILFSTYGIFSRLLNEELTVFQQLSYRYFIGTLLVAFIIIFIKREKIRFQRFFKRSIVLFALLVPFSFYFFIRAFIESKLSISISGFYAGTLISSLIIGRVIIKEKLTHFGIAGLSLIMLSFAFLNDLDFSAITHIGLLWGFISGAMYGAANYIKKISGKYTKEEMLLVLAFSTTVIMQLLSFINRETVTAGLTFTTTIALFLFTFVVLLAEYLTLVGFRNFELYLGSIILSLEIVFTLIVGLIFFLEYPTTAELIGISLVIGSVVLTNIPTKTGD